MSTIYGFFIVITYIVLLLWAIVESEKTKGGTGLFIGMAIMGIAYALIWPLFYIFLIWSFFFDKD